MDAMERMGPSDLPMAQYNQRKRQTRDGININLKEAQSYYNLRPRTLAQRQQEERRRLTRRPYERKRRRENTRQKVTQHATLQIEQHQQAVQTTESYKNTQLIARQAEKQWKMAKVGQRTKQLIDSTIETTSSEDDTYQYNYSQFNSSEDDASEYRYSGFTSRQDDTYDYKHSEKIMLQKKNYDLRPRHNVNYREIEMPASVGLRHHSSSAAGFSQMQQHGEHETENQQDQHSEFVIQPINLEYLGQDVAERHLVGVTDQQRGVLFCGPGSRDPTNQDSEDEDFVYDEEEYDEDFINSSFDTEEFLDEYFKERPCAFKQRQEHTKHHSESPCNSRQRPSASKQCSEHTKHHSDSPCDSRQRPSAFKQCQEHTKHRSDSPCDSRQRPSAFKQCQEHTKHHSDSPCDSMQVFPTEPRAETCDAIQRNNRASAPQSSESQA